jgi:DNA-3-methyladenine glycosylase
VTTVRRGRPVPRRFFAADAPVVAPALLNKLLVVGDCVGRIVEVEAYTADDPASHSFRGRTARNAVMFGPPGHLYVYFTYGMHHCANVVTGAVGDGQAVLVRAVAPLAGLGVMRARRGAVRDVELANGPAKLCRAFGLDRGWDGTALGRGGSAYIAVDGLAPPPEPLVTTRIGIRVGIERPWRWCVPGDPHVSRALPAGGRPR